MNRIVAWILSSNKAINLFMPSLLASNKLI
jgi:hypothetical protein